MSTPDPGNPIASVLAPPKHARVTDRFRHLMRSRVGKTLATLGLAVLMTFLLYQLRPFIYQFWQSSILQMLAALQLEDVRLFTVNTLLPDWHGLEMPAIMLPVPDPDWTAWLCHFAAGLSIFGLAGLIQPPFRAVLRTLGGLHVVSLLLLLAAVGPQPYTIEEHTRSLGLLAQGMLICLPAFMCASHYIIERNIERRIVATLLLAGYLIASVPIKLVAHAMLINLLSPLITPVLFLVFGPAFDVLALTALYAWAVSWRHGISNEDA